MIFYGTRWLGNGVLPLLSVAALIYLAWRGLIGRRLLPSVIGVFVFVAVVVAVAIYTFAFWEPPRNQWIVFSPLYLVLWVGAIPVQELFNLLLGEDNFVEEHLLVISGMVTFGCAGQVVGSALQIAKKIRRNGDKAAQPGATDNPDDPQRLREDH